mmetsp:Transcript_46845/g.134980  ORF Transcript_46845/g.134980 Transcript_46845/m.134980 type:complete len:81 (-) Transcript_46845:876-1118(-)
MRRRERHASIDSSHSPVEDATDATKELPITGELDHQRASFSAQGRAEDGETDCSRSGWILLGLAVDGKGGCSPAGESQAT